jgi:hypothetical protein
MIDMGSSETQVFGWLVVALAIAVSVAVGWRTVRRSRALHRRPAAAAGETIYSTLGPDGQGEVLDIDPLHEAEVYAAYGNKEAALKVLVKASTVAPEREDIRTKIAELTSK